MMTRVIAILSASILFVLPAVLVGPLQAQVAITAVNTHAIPDDVIYRHFFRHVAKYQDIAEKAEASGRSSPFRHSFRTRLSLTPTEEEDLNRIAADCMTQLLGVQQQIAAVVSQFRSAYPPGQLKPRVKLPPPPPELAPLVAQKKAIIIDARNKLRTALGDEEFSRVDSLIKAQMTATMFVGAIAH
jgi:hypothetical protein